MIRNILPSQLPGTRYLVVPAGLLSTLPREQTRHVIHPHSGALPPSTGHRQGGRPHELIHVLRQYGLPSELTENRGGVEGTGGGAQAMP